MPFIGQQPLTGAYSKLDSITTSATATYNLQLDSAAYSPASANHLLVSLNGVMQAPQDSFTISGSTITFASALTSSDNIDFIMALGDVLNIGTPSDGTVNSASIVTGAVTDAKIASGISSSKLTGALPAISGASLTGFTDAQMPAGSVLQVVESTSMDTTTIASTSFQDIDLNVTITPSSTSSKILVMVDFAYTQDGADNQQAFIQILRDATAIGNHIVGYDTPGGDVGFGCHIQKLDSPSSTSAITYKTQARTTYAVSQFRPKTDGSIIAMEISG